MLNDSIIQPAAFDLPPSANLPNFTFAAMAAYRPLVFGQDNAFDAALARTNLQLSHPSLFNLGFFATPVIPPVVGRYVCKMGRTSDKTFGIIRPTAFQVRIDYSKYGQGTAFFSTAITIEGVDQKGSVIGGFSEGGDSGALVLDVATWRPLGMVIGADNRFSYVTPLQPILDFWQVDLFRG
jgi:hypothetical protein